MILYQSIAGFGTDTCVSIRGPASHQSLVGLRPSLGFTSRAGIIPLRLGQDTGGPIGASPRPLLLALGARLEQHAVPCVMRITP